MRLTYKLEEPLITTYLHYDYMRIGDYDISKGNYGKITNDEIYNKLGQLEDIEEELGIDLITLFKALKDGIRILDDGLSYTDWINFDIRKKTFKGKVSDHEVFIKDYGKTWALTKEELL